MQVAPFVTKGESQGAEDVAHLPPGHLVSDAMGVVGTVHAHVDATPDAPMIIGRMERDSLDVGAVVVPLEGTNEAQELIEAGDVRRTVSV